MRGGSTVSQGKHCAQAIRVRGHAAAGKLLHDGAARVRGRAHGRDGAAATPRLACTPAGMSGCQAGREAVGGNAFGKGRNSCRSSGEPPSGGAPHKARGDA